MEGKKTKRSAVKSGLCLSQPGKEFQDDSISLAASLADVMDALPFYAMLVDAGHHILMTNCAVQKHLGVSPQDIVGKYCPKVIHGLDGPFPGCPLEEAVREEERNRIAHNLHDETSQVLSSLTAHLEAALGRLPDGAFESRAMLEKARDLAARILDDLHKLIYELHPFLLYDMGLVAAVSSLINTRLEPAGVKVYFQTKGRMRRLSPHLEITLFRVIQEAFNNIARHARTRKVDVDLRFRKASISIRIADDGRGFDVREALNMSHGLRGFGILGMKEKMEMVGGTVSIRSCPGEGTQIDIEAPLSPEPSLPGVVDKERVNTTLTELSG